MIQMANINTLYWVDGSGSRSRSRSFTDKSGADYCIECIKEMCEPKVQYNIPGFENLDDSLEKLTISKPKNTKSNIRGVK